jgi:hypothetical protein
MEKSNGLPIPLLGLSGGFIKLSLRSEVNITKKIDE